MVDIASGAPKHLGHVGAVGHQTTALGKETKRVNLEDLAAKLGA
jgi:hypothetical protein